MLKSDYTKAQADFMFAMAQEHNSISSREIENFLIDIGYFRRELPDLYKQKEYRQDMSKPDFETFFQKNEDSLGKWMKDLIKQYKNIVEAIDNGEVENYLHPVGNENKSLVFPPEILKEINELKLSPKTADCFTICYEKLKNDPKEKLEIHEKMLRILQKYKISKPLGIKIISSSMSNEKVTLSGFIRTMAYLTEENSCKERSKLLFGLYANNGSNILEMYYYFL